LNSRENKSAIFSAAVAPRCELYFEEKVQKRRYLGMNRGQPPPRDLFERRVGGKLSHSKSAVFLDLFPTSDVRRSQKYSAQIVHVHIDNRMDWCNFKEKDGSSRAAIPRKKS
jgi:hypothetical protein